MMEKSRLINEFLIKLTTEKFVHKSDAVGITALDEFGTPLIALGRGNKHIIYSSAASDRVACELMESFAYEYSSALCANIRLSGIPVEYLSNKFFITIIPFIDGQSREYLCNYVRFTEQAIAHIEFYSSFSGIRYSHIGKNGRVANSVAMMCGVKISGESAGQERNESAVPKLEIGLKNIFDAHSDFAAYVNIRQALFRIPMMI